jgi:hypothetical protein
MESRAVRCGIICCSGVFALRPKWFANRLKALIWRDSDKILGAMQRTFGHCLQQ